MFIVPVLEEEDKSLSVEELIMKLPETPKMGKTRRKHGVMSVLLGRSQSERDSLTVCDLEYSHAGYDLEESRPSVESSRIPGGILTRATQKQSLWAFTDDIESKKENRHIRWGDVKIQSHALVLGDNPCCVGPPLSSDWKPFETVQVGIDQYELNRPEARSKYQLAVPKSIREEMLKRSGYSRSELRKGSEDASKIRKQREKSNKLTPRERFDSLLLKLMVGKKRKRKEITEDEARLSDSIRNVSGITYEQAALGKRFSDSIRNLSGITHEQAALGDSLGKKVAT
jgi:hypothetical protein